MYYVAEICLGSRHSRFSLLLYLHDMMIREAGVSMLTAGTTT